MAHAAFISYASQDEAQARTVCEALERSGIRCWMSSRDILPGEDWPTAIFRAINQSQVVVLVFSSHANNSKNVLNEVVYAEAHGVQLVPLRTEDVPLSKEMTPYLSRKNWMDAIPLEANLEKLVETLTEILKKKGYEVTQSLDRAQIWQTIAGILSFRKVTPLIMAGLLAALVISIFLGRSPGNKLRPSGTISNSGGDSRPNLAPQSVEAPGTKAARPEMPAYSGKCCYSITAYAPKIFPFGLVHSVPNHDFLYWFHVKIKNDCDYPLHLMISFKVRQGPALVVEEPALLSVNPGETRSEKVNPFFTFLKDDTEGILEVTWKISDDKKNLLQQGTKDIHIQPKHFYPGTLYKFDGKSAPKEFSLAILAAWALASDEETTKRTNLLLRDLALDENHKSLAQKWMRKCYGIFSLPRPLIRIHPQREPFSPAKERIISTPKEMIEAANADPLEGALLVCALSKKIHRLTDIKLALITVGGGTNTAIPQEDFLAWHLNEEDWQAIDLAKTNALTFEDNVSTASPKLAKLFQDQPTIPKDLKKSGVFLDQEGTVMGIDFFTAAKNFRISGLP